MRLTQHTDFALRLLMLLAAEPAHRHTIAGVAARYGISRNHLMKVVQTLVHAGFVEGARGRGGGLRLMRPADRISIGEVVRCTEEDFDLVECFAAPDQCRIAAGCGLIAPMREARDAFLAALDRHTLAQVIAAPGRRRPLSRFLGIPVTG